MIPEFSVDHLEALIMHVILFYKWRRCLPYHALNFSTSFDQRTLYAKCSTSCAKCSEYNGRLSMADNVGRLWDELHYNPAGTWVRSRATAFEPDLAIR